MTKPLYTAEATAHGGREGKVHSTNDRLQLDLSMPKELGGPGAAGATNPEELFACGYAACFHSALKFVAMRQKVDTSDSTVTARVSLYRNEIGGFKLGVELTVSLPKLVARGGGEAGGGGPPGVPVQQRDARQHRGRAHGGVGGGTAATAA